MLISSFYGQHLVECACLTANVCQGPRKRFILRFGVSHFLIEIECTTFLHRAVKGAPSRSLIKENQQPQAVMSLRCCPSTTTAIGFDAVLTLLISRQKTVCSSQITTSVPLLALTEQFILCNGRASDGRGAAMGRPLAVGLASNWTGKVLRSHFLFHLCPQCPFVILAFG